MEINLATFKELTGLDFNYFAKHIGIGDDWGIFLKVTSFIEGLSKSTYLRFIKGLNPTTTQYEKKYRALNFSNVLKELHNANIIDQETRNFADFLRLERNVIVHNGLNITFDIYKDSSYLTKYSSQLESYFSVQGSSLEKGEVPNATLLIGSSIVYVAILAKSLKGEDWLN